MDKDKLLPIGSIVLLKNGTKKLMVIGYLGLGSTDLTDFNDYVGCFFPEGYLAPNATFAFKKENIKSVYYMGYSNNETVVFNKKIKAFKDKYVSNGKLIKGIDEITKELTGKEIKIDE